MTSEKIQGYLDKIPSHLFQHCYDKFPFVFLDFEVFKHDWLICFSIDGVHIKTIINDVEKLKNLFVNKLSNRILIAYNGTGYDKLIMLALLNGLDPKEVNDNIIHNFNFNFNNEYGSRIITGTDFMWYEPSTRNGGSLKTYEACEGENIYESKVDFDKEEPLTPDEIEETIQYCSFDVKQLIKYFYKEHFDSFLGHIGLINQTLQARPYMKFDRVLPKTDASLVGTYLCTNQGISTKKHKDTIKLPDNIHLGKYKEAIEKFLEIPILTLKNGNYNGLNSWSLNVIKKSIAKCDDRTDIDKVNKKIDKTLEKIKKSKLELQKFKEKEILTEKQQEKLNTLPEIITKSIEQLQLLRKEVAAKEEILSELKNLKSKLDMYEEDLSNPEYNKILSEIINLAAVTDNAKLPLLTSYLMMTKEEIFNFQYTEDKKSSRYNSITVQYPFELILDIKGVPHAFKTGGIHSIARQSMFFDKRTEHDKNRRLLIADVGSLYPNLMRVFGLCSIGMDNPDQFAQMIFDRIELKKKKDPFANVLKLILNTTYGCMGSAYNNLYDPTNRLKVCIFGQSAIVDLLDKLEDQVKGLEIFQSNTDGIVVSCEDNEYDLVVSIIHEWENRTGLEMEIDESLYLAQKDVSNYILIEK